MDFTGGFLSLLQLFLDGYISGELQIIGEGALNAVKFGLGIIAMLFDVLFMV